VINGLDDARLGCHPIAWERAVPFTQVLDDIASLGYAGTEGYGDYRDDPDTFKHELVSRGLEVATVYASGAFYDPARAADAVTSAIDAATFVRRMGGDVLCVATGGTEARRRTPGLHPDGHRPDGLDAEGWRTLANSLTRVGERCLELGVMAAFHNHVGTFVETRDELDTLMRITDPVILFLAPDTGHLYYGGADAVAVYRDYGPRIRYNHLKDVNAAAIEHARREHLDQRACMDIGGFAELGEGCLDFDAILSFLGAAHYGGWLMVEQDKSLKTPRESARISREFLREKLGR
jgi:inosose dehydratase